MLLYLTSNENIGLFDFLTDETGMLVKKLSGEFILNKFVIHDMRNLSHFSYIVVDLEALKDDVEDIIESIKAFKTMYDSRIILFAEKADKSLLDRIIKETEVYNIVTAKTIKKIKDEIRMCISPQGMSKEYLIKSMNLDLDVPMEDIPKYSFIGENTKIIVAGSMPRVGTTTTAINIASYLASIGAKVSYTEANGNDHLMDIYSYYAPDIPINENYFTYKKVSYFFNASVPVGGYNFNVIDIGQLKKNNVKVFELGDAKILCGGSKPYELRELKKSLELINAKYKDIFFLLPEGEILDIKNKLPISHEQIYTFKFSSSLFDQNINVDIWQRVLSQYIIEHKGLTPFNINENCG